jgi:hypothetical protein
LKSKYDLRNFSSISGRLSISSTISLQLIMKDWLENFSCIKLTEN